VVSFKDPGFILEMKRWPNTRPKLFKVHL